MKVMKIKKGVSIFGLKPVMSVALLVCKQVYADMANLQNFVITSGNEFAPDRGDDSDHYKGYAFDLRIWGWTEAQKQTARKRIAERIGDEFIVLLKSDHMHIAFRRKRHPGEQLYTDPPSS